MAADHPYHAVERAELTRRLQVRWGPVDARSGAAEIVGLDARALIERFSTRRAEVLDWLDEHELEGIEASSAAAAATRQPKPPSTPGQFRGGLRADADIEALVTATMAAVQGGLVLTQARRDPAQLACALDAAYSHLRAQRASTRPASLAAH
jgi:hypothetical protein